MDRNEGRFTVHTKRSASWASFLDRLFRRTLESRDDQPTTASGRFVSNKTKTRVVFAHHACRYGGH